jgi:ABC-type polysaccharide/polyol phosphate transport system ATPase subunit
MQAVIVTEGLGKRYRLGERADAYGTLRAALGGALRRRDRRQELWALRDVHLRVEQGEVVGIIGRNGAGKTTLLKLIARITEPTEGTARMRGRVGALLEVGTGFHFELTGRENIYFNGAVLGMSRQEIRRRFDQIVEFSGVERFLDTPLKRYSAGMYLRLAFSVAAHLEPDIVIVDEVLAVGDAEFRHKCAQRIEALRQEGRTILLVSHDLASIQRMCSRCVLLSGGRVLADGPPADVVLLHLESSVEQASRDGNAHGPVEVRSVAVTDPEGLSAPTSERPLVLQIELGFREQLPGTDVSFYILDHAGVRVVNDALSDTAEAPPLGSAPGYRITARMEPVLVPGQYTLGMWIGSQAEDLFLGEVASFKVLPGPGDELRSKHQPLGRVPLQWEVS